MTANRPYDSSDPRSIEAYAQGLVGRSLREVLDPEARTSYQSGGGKGNIGDVVEREYFGIHPGNVSAPDFPEAGVELKTTPLKRVRSHFRAKERLVLQMIDYDKVAHETWERSSFLAKSRLMLLVFYLWEQDVEALDYVFKIARLWSIPEADVEIIRDDWEKIRDKIASGEAHLLSEGDTVYLAACVKAAKGTDRRSQPMSDELARRRAFSLKPSYMNSVIEQLLQSGPVRTPTTRASAVPSSRHKEQSIVGADELRSGKTFEQAVHDRFSPYLGKTADEIAGLLDLHLRRDAKNFYSVLTRRILGADADSEIAEFRKGDITVRTLRLKPNGVPKEAISFKAFDYLDLVQQEWESSDLRDDLTRRFFFVIYSLDSGGVPTLLRTQFWTMPLMDVEYEGRACFLRTVDLIRRGMTDSLPKSTENLVCHVRPHGRDSSDTLPTPTGGRAVRKSFWLNQRYLAQQLASRHDS